MAADKPAERGRETETETETEREEAWEKVSY